MSAIRIFDNHQHVGGIPGVPGHHPSGVLDAAQIEMDYGVRVGVMRALGIEQAALMPGHSYPRPKGLADTRAVNDTLLAYQKRDPARFPAVIGTVEPRYGLDGLAEIDRMHELGFQGVSWHHRQEGLAIDHPVMHAFIERMQQRGMLPFIHCFPDGDFEAVWRLRHLAEAFPDMPFLCMDTAAHPEAFEEALRAGEAAPNIHVDITSLGLGPDWLRRMVAALGSRRVILGTNLYSLQRPNHCKEIDAVQQAGFSEAERRDILGGNARRLLKLAE
ncbi:MAG TPA: amidohydrolase family protein [Burkholderiales bacterium]|nr:amidohydrolase family protein [Burkholderiales bacterium]